MDPMTAITGIGAITKHLFKKLVFSRKAIITILVAAFVAVVMGYVGTQDVDPLNDGTDLLDTLILFFFMPVLAMIYGASLIRDEIDDKSITHVAVAPLDRAFSYLGYYIPLVLAVGLSMVIVTTAGFLAFFAQNDMGAEAWKIYAEFIALVLVGSLVYSALFLAVSVLLKKPVFFGLFYAFIWEGFIGSLPGAIQKASIKYYLRSIGSDWVDYGSISAFDQAYSPSGSALVIAGLSICLVLLGAYLFRETELA